MKNFKMKTVCVLTVIVMTLSMLTGCGDKSPIKTVDFENVASQKGYVIEDGTDYFSDYDYIKLVTLTAPQDRAFQIEFYELNDEAVAKSFYDSNRSNFVMMKVDDCIEDTGSGKNYDYYKLEMFGKYMMVERVGNTVIFVPSTDNFNKEAIEAFLTEIRY